ncbi:hypothetical protein TREMEDRAFT_58400 [Tremella mesenterica DSM 1558]|uniref:uncharacterized protein n=1 Tax=Tremella mesenterica (strain ATCC 24925 / CBS 8224 / DSM 1558 / NBRC 9311 / NRRL Y-6157 / RJB 2259-6 / UBC 559-6) TaxID=578456 RepID=UPI0003F49324|nr:uncharacterized protein TREMEDRAFT_58400 [Tremella mesenterica DSM 1558]EIW72240.1 hypothetical protein TREMEDRAFT_58400 [Tremella mesenterica DSM 1558]
MTTVMTTEERLKFQALQHIDSALGGIAKLNMRGFSYIMTVNNDVCTIEQFDIAVPDIDFSEDSQSTVIQHGTWVTLPEEDDTQEQLLLSATAASEDARPLHGGRDEAVYVRRAVQACAVAINDSLSALHAMGASTDRLTDFIAQKSSEFKTIWRNTDLKQYEDVMSQFVPQQMAKQVSDLKIEMGLPPPMTVADDDDDDDEEDTANRNAIDNDVYQAARDALGLFDSFSMG